MRLPWQEDDLQSAADVLGHPEAGDWLACLSRTDSGDHRELKDALSALDGLRSVLVDALAGQGRIFQGAEDGLLAMYDAATGVVRRTEGQGREETQTALRACLRIVLLALGLVEDDLSPYLWTSSRR